MTAINKWTEDCLQGWVGEWWEKDDSREVKTGALLLAIVHFVGETPYRLRVVGRNNPTSHNSAKFSLEAFNLGSRNPDIRLPVAGLPQKAGQSYAVYPAKTRPVLVLSNSWVPEGKREQVRVKGWF